MGHAPQEHVESHNPGLVNLLYHESLLETFNLLGVCDHTGNEVTVSQVLTLSCVLNADATDPKQGIARVAREHSLEGPD